MYAALEFCAPLANEDAEVILPLATLGHLLAEAGDFKGAFDTLDYLSRGTSKVNYLAGIAEAQARDKRDADARKTIQRAIEAGRLVPNDAVWGRTMTDPDDDPMVPVRQTLALAQARTGDLDGAFKTISELGHARFAPLVRKQVVETIVNQRLEADDIPGALRAVDLITPADMMFQDDKVDLLERIARRRARREELTPLLEWVGKQPAPRGKLQLIRGLADGIAERFEPAASPPPSKPASPSDRTGAKPAKP